MVKNFSSPDAQMCTRTSDRPKVPTGQRQGESSFLFCWFLEPLDLDRSSNSCRPGARRTVLRIASSPCAKCAARSSRRGAPRPAVDGRAGRLDYVALPSVTDQAKCAGVGPQKASQPNTSKLHCGANIVLTIDSFPQRHTSMCSCVMRMAFAI